MQNLPGDNMKGLPGKEAGFISQAQNSKWLGWYARMGKWDKIGVACLAVFLALALINALISSLLRTPFLDVLWVIWGPVSYFLSVIQMWLFIAGVVIVALAGPKRRRALLSAPQFIWGLIQVWRLGKTELIRRRQEDRIKRERQQERERESYERWFMDEMTPEEFEQELIKLGEERRAEGRSAGEIEVEITLLENKFAEALETRELVERRRAARERRRAGLEPAEEDVVTPRDAYLLSQIHDEAAQREERQEEAEQRRRQEEYENAVAREEAELRREERRGLEEERRDRNRDREEERRYREEDRRDRNRDREEDRREREKDRELQERLSAEERRERNRRRR